MRHLVPFRVYESQTTSGLTPDQEAFLDRYTENSWSVNPTTGLVDIQGSFNFVNKKAKSFFGVKFGNVTGNFACYGNKLRSLAGAPQKVGGDFDCYSNQLQSLEGAPQEVDGDFNCSRNQLRSLKGSPRKVGRHFNCMSNYLQSLEGAPREVGWDFNCNFNPLQSLKGAPLEEINGSFVCNAFQIKKGEWNMKGLIEILKNGKEEAKKLMLTLPIFGPTFWNSRISENPESTILELSEFWDDLPLGVRWEIRIPRDLRDDFDNLLHLVRMGIM